MSAALFPHICGSVGPRAIAIVLLEGNLVRGDAERSRQIAAMSAIAFDRYAERLRVTAHVGLARQLHRRLARSQLLTLSESFARLDPRAPKEMASALASMTDQGVIARSLREVDHPVRYIRGGDGQTWRGGERSSASVPRRS